MIIYAPIAYGVKYNELSLRMIDTFNKYSSQGKLCILTDNVDFYANHVSDNISVVKGEDTGPFFKANLKYQCLKEALKIASVGDVVVVMDADCFLTNRLDESFIQTLDNGLHIKAGGEGKIAPSDLQNNAIIYKILTLNPDADATYYIFREACLVFKIDETAEAFVKEWERIFSLYDVHPMVHNGETFDIQIAAIFSNYRVNDLKTHELSEMFHMTDANGGIGSPIG